MAEALGDAMSGADLATKADLAATKADLEAHIAALRAELKTEIVALRVELKAEIALVRRDMEVLRRDLTIRLGGMIVVAIGVLLAAMRYMLMPHP